MQLAFAIGVLGIAAVPVQGIVEFYYYLKLGFLQNYDTIYFMSEEQIGYVGSIEWIGLQKIIWWILDVWVAVPIMALGYVVTALLQTLEDYLTGLEK